MYVRTYALHLVPIASSQPRLRIRTQPVAGRRSAAGSGCQSLRPQRAPWCSAWPGVVATRPSKSPTFVQQTGNYLRLWMIWMASEILDLGSFRGNAVLLWEPKSGAGRWASNGWSAWALISRSLSRTSKYPKIAGFWRENDHRLWIALMTNYLWVLKGTLVNHMHTHILSDQKWPLMQQMGTWSTPHQKWRSPFGQPVIFPGNSRNSIHNSWDQPGSGSSSRTRGLKKIYVFQALSRRSVIIFLNITSTKLHSIREAPPISPRGRASLRSGSSSVWRLQVVIWSSEIPTEKVQKLGIPHFVGTDSRENRLY